VRIYSNAFLGEAADEISLTGWVRSRAPAVEKETKSDSLRGMTIESKGKDRGQEAKAEAKGRSKGSGWYPTLVAMKLRQGWGTRD